MNKSFEKWWKKKKGMLSHPEHSLSKQSRWMSELAWNAAISQSAATPQWYPIKTAPKDGTYILGNEYESGHVIVKWMHKRWIKKGHYITVRINLWQPLPEPPKQ